MLLLAGAAGASAYTFGDTIPNVGTEVVVFDWTTQRCNNNDDDIPDQPARAFRDGSGQVVLVDSHHTTRPYKGATLGSVVHGCTAMMTSHSDSRPEMYNDKEWLASTWTEDGHTVYGLVHSEYQGYNYEPGNYCIRPRESFDEEAKCWYNTLTLARSTDDGVNFSHAVPQPPPGPAPHLVAGSPYKYARTLGPIGFFQPSNIVRANDGNLYILSHVEDFGDQKNGTCLLRTNDISNPASWRMWNGLNFNNTSIDPYRTTLPPGSPLTEHVCEPVSPATIGTMSESLTWSTYFKKWLLVGAWQGARGDPYPDSGFYYFLSDNLVDWSAPKLLMRTRLPWTFQCGTDSEQTRDPSILDEKSESRNFDTTGQRAFLYFTRFQVSGCSTSLDRDLVRIPIEFTNRQPGGPTIESLTSPTVPSLNPPVGTTVQINANNVRDSDGGTITAFKWDLDGDGSFETDTGTRPTASRTYNANERVTVTVRACDNSGKATDRTLVLDVGTAPLQEPPAQLGWNSTGGECPGAGGGGGGGGGGGTPVTPKPNPPKSNPVGIFKLLGKPVSRKDGSLVLRVQLPSAGRLSARGVGKRTPIRPAQLKAKKAGTFRLTLRLSSAGKKLLRKKRRAKAKTTLVFTPTAGKAQKSTRTLTLRRARPR